MSLQQTLTIACDHAEPCSTMFMPASGKPGEAKAEARDRGWYIGVGDKAYCPTHVAAIGIRVRKRGASG